ncbi:hypothetical protein C8Q78DRAFT_975181, partial [Trametes maxima]
IRPPVEDITQFLSEGVIPMLFYDGSRLHVRKSITGPYVTISHVWADGMGSMTEVGLPRCVVERISGLVTSLLPEHGSFWIDSLCIPAEGELRKKAIKLMASTYRDAAKVLVIDADIRTTCSESTPREEALLRITFSGWNKWVWTLQEGLLARELWFEFIEGPVTIDQGSPSLHLSLDMRLAQALSLSHPGSAAESPMSEEMMFNIEAMDVVANSTTKPEDETLAVSSILATQINLDALLSITGEDVQQKRMKALLIRMHEIPVVLTTVRMSRLTLLKFSWAPRALTAAMHGWQATEATGTCTC